MNLKKEIEIKIQVLLDLGFEFTAKMQNEFSGREKVLQRHCQ